MAVAGETPNIANRLQSLAEPGPVVISQAAHRLIEGFFVCRSIGAPALNGVSRPLDTYPVFQETGIRTRFEKAVATGLTLPYALVVFVGWAVSALGRLLEGAEQIREGISGWLAHGLR
jgi:hypothetical protein